MTETQTTETPAVEVDAELAEQIAREIDEAFARVRASRARFAPRDSLPLRPY